MKLSSKTSSSFLSESHEDDEIDFTDYSAPFLSGHGFALRCHWWFSKNLPKLGVNPNRDNRAVYVRTDDLPVFFSSKLVPENFVLVTHNSDFVIGEGHAQYIKDPRVQMWLALNKGIDHPKLKAIPDGLQNACYDYGNARLLSAMADSLGNSLPSFRHYKSKLFYANYTIGNRIKERGDCAHMCQSQGIDLTGRKPYLNYLADLSETMFSFCPDGSGIDSCRPWESLYLKTIPIVKKHYPSFDHVKDFRFPMVLVNQWNEDHFDRRNFSREHYEKVWGSFDTKELYMEQYCESLNRLYGVSI